MIQNSFLCFTISSSFISGHGYSAASLYSSPISFVFIINTGLSLLHSENKHSLPHSRPPLLLLHSKHLIPSLRSGQQRLEQGCLNVVSVYKCVKGQFTLKRLKKEKTNGTLRKPKNVMWKLSKPYDSHGLHRLYFQVFVYSFVISFMVCGPTRLVLHFWRRIKGRDRNQSTKSLLYETF